MNRLFKQSGFSIVEMLVAMIIGLIMLLGVYQLFISSKETHRASQSLMLLQENARFAIDKITTQVQQAGFRSPPDYSENRSFSAISTIFPSTSPYISGNSGGGVNGSDTLIIRYQGSGNGAGTADGSIRDCSNIAVDANALSTNIYQINNNYQLTCNNTVIIDNIEAMRILFGEDLTQDRNANRYVPADFPTLNSNNIVSVRISILLRTENETRETLDTTSYNLLGLIVNPSNDYHFRRIFTTTIQLRNLDQSGG